MARVRSLCLHCATLCALLVLLSAQDFGLECEDKDGLLSEMTSDVDVPSECMLSCTVLTYGRMLQRKDTLTVRFKSSHAGELGEHCWSSKVRCNSGHHFLSAYILLPLDMSEEKGIEHGFLTISPNHKEILKLHHGHSPLAEGCGLRFDVTTHFTAQDSQSTFCIQINPQHQGTSKIQLRCPPFLVTMWRNQNHPPTNQGGG